MLLLGMVVSALIFGALLANFSQLRLIQVVQGAAVATMVLNLVARLEAGAAQPRRRPRPDRARPAFQQILGRRSAAPTSRVRRLTAAGLGTLRLRHAGRPAGTLWRRRSCSLTVAQTTR